MLKPKIILLNIRDSNTTLPVTTKYQQVLGYAHKIYRCQLLFILSRSCQSLNRISLHKYTFISASASGSVRADVGRL